LRCLFRSGAPRTEDGTADADGDERTGAGADGDERTGAGRRARTRAEDTLRGRFGLQTEHQAQVYVVPGVQVRGPPPRRQACS